MGHYLNRVWCMKLPFVSCTLNVIMVSDAVKKHRHTFLYHPNHEAHTDTLCSLAAWTLYHDRVSLFHIQPPWPYIHFFNSFSMHQSTLSYVTRSFGHLALGLQRRHFCIIQSSMILICSAAQEHSYVFISTMLLTCTSMIVIWYSDCKVLGNFCLPWPSCIMGDSDGTYPDECLAL